MAIYVPGKRSRRGRMVGGKRSVVASLQLVAMVDLFTVMVVFLLQNYNTTGEIIEIPQNVILPQAQEVRELSPANVLIISDRGVQFNNEIVTSFEQVTGQQDWMIQPLYDRVVATIDESKKEEEALAQRLRTAVERIQVGERETGELARYQRATIQADENIDFLTLKKIMYTMTEAGIVEINFAVIQKFVEESI